MDNPGSDEQGSSESKTERRRKHYNVQRLIAYGGLVGLVVLIMQYCQMRDTLRTDQRAWVTVTTATLKEPPAINKSPQIELEITNSGKTPALKVKVLGVVYLAAEEPGATNFGDTSQYPTPVIGPSAHIEQVIERPPLGEEEELRLRDYSNALYGSGEIEYTDIFGKQHRTGFCVRFRYKRGTAELEYSACLSGNYAD